MSRLYAHSKNYDMDITLDYNIELYPLKKGELFALALATSLSKGPPTGGANANGAGAGAGGDDEKKDEPLWRPDGRKGRGDLDDDYDYVMYGKVRLTVSCDACVFSTTHPVCFSL